MVSLSVGKVPLFRLVEGVASIFGQRLGLKQARLSSLIPVGAAAAVSAAFNTPIAGVLFSLEEVVGDLHAPVLGSAVLASATAWVTLHLLLGGEPLFHVPQYELVHPFEFLIYALLGVAGGLCSLAFVKLTIHLRAQFLKLPDRTRWVHPVFGGLVVGLLGLWSPAVLGVGYDYVGQVLNGDFALGFVITLLDAEVDCKRSMLRLGQCRGHFRTEPVSRRDVRGRRRKSGPSIPAGHNGESRSLCAGRNGSPVRRDHTSAVHIGVHDLRTDARLLHRCALDDCQHGEPGHLSEFPARPNLRSSRFAGRTFIFRVIRGNAMSQVRSCQISCTPSLRSCPQVR